jgi:hypothetical protein
MIVPKREYCGECGCLFSSAIEKARHPDSCAAADSKYLLEDVVTKKGVITSLFRIMVIVAVLKNPEGVHIYSLKGVNCPSLAVTALKGEIDPWYEFH